MGIRVSQRGIYNNSINYSNKALTELVDLNMQASSQKKINKPSDDPVGMARILMLRTAEANNEQYAESLENATAWLSQQDQTLLSVQNVLVRIKELTEQGASGTYEGTRDEIASELRELYGQLINLANTKFDGRHIFSGHKYDESAYEAALGVTSYNEEFADVDFKVTGGADRTIVVQFLEDGQIGEGPTSDMDFRYSKDGGKTWVNSTLPAGTTTLDLDGVQVDFRTPGNVPVDVYAVDPENDTRTDNGTWLYIHPTAVYQGDDNYSPGSVDVVYNNPSVTASGQGEFHRDIKVRIDDVTGAGVRYSYSTDGGASWTTVDSDATSYPMQLAVPGGFLNISPNSAGDQILPGDQFTIKPRRADLEFQIGDNQYVKVNNVGKDIFGGLYQEYGNDWALPVNGGGDTNIFEVVGRIVAAAETNSQQGMQEGLPELTNLMKELTKEMAKIGGKMNSLEISAGILDEEQYNIASRLMQIEDVDVAELMTKLTQQQYVYQSVLQSSSLVMRMSLMDYL